MSKDYGSIYVNLLQLPIAGHTLVKSVKSSAATMTEAINEQKKSLDACPIDHPRGSTIADICDPGVSPATNLTPPLTTHAKLTSRTKSAG